MTYEEDNKFDAEIIDECLRILLRARGCDQGADNMSRELVVSFSRGNYGQISSAIVEVNGSPVRGFACIIFRGSVREREDSYHDNMSNFRLNIPEIYIKNEDLRLVKVRCDSPKIIALSRLIARSIDLTEKGENVAIWAKSSDKTVTRSDQTDSASSVKSDSLKCETQKKDEFLGDSTKGNVSCDKRVTGR